MPNITLAVSEDLKKDMDLFKFMNWSSVARSAIEEKIKVMKMFKEFTKDSTMTEEDAIELGRKVKAGMAKRLRESRESRKITS